MQRTFSGLGAAVVVLLPASAAAISEALPTYRAHPVSYRQLGEAVIRVPPTAFETVSEALLGDALALCDLPNVDVAAHLRTLRADPWVLVARTAAARPEGSVRVELQDRDDPKRAMWVEVGIHDQLDTYSALGDPKASPIRRISCHVQTSAGSIAMFRRTLSSRYGARAVFLGPVGMTERWRITPTSGAWPKGFKAELSSYRSDAGGVVALLTVTNGRP